MNYPERVCPGDHLGFGVSKQSPFLYCSCTPVTSGRPAASTSEEVAAQLSIMRTSLGK